MSPVRGALDFLVHLRNANAQWVKGLQVYV